MRETKFRGFGIFEWFYGSLVKDGDKCYIIEGIETSNEYGDGTDLYATVWSEVSAESVGEFTGLKDKNGKEIYEGDIVKVRNVKDIHAVIIFHNFAWFSEWNNSVKSKLKFSKSDSFEVIGNIYENPELIQS